MEANYEEKRTTISKEKKQLWYKEQAFIRNQINRHDILPCKPQELELIGGVDLSFSGKYQNGACAGLLVYSRKYRKIIYEDYLYVKLKEEYVPGFLAFRQLAPTLEMFRRLKAKKPHLWPQVVLVDGNGILHKNECGYASHLGVILDLPTVGCAKTFFDIDGLHQIEIENQLRDKLTNFKDSLILRGKSGKQWCTAILSDEDQCKHLYVSIGHKISLETSTQLVKQLILEGQSPEPIRLVDNRSRKMIRFFKEEDYNAAPSFDMIYLSK